MTSRTWSTGLAAVFGFITFNVIDLINYLDGPEGPVYLLPLPLLFAMIALLHNVVFAQHWSAGPDQTGVREKKW
jgi:hypothetical protein